MQDAQHTPQHAPADPPRPGFAPDTLLLTARGERPAATLAPGEMLLTLSGQGAPLKPIRALHRVTAAALRLRAGALGPMMPLRDLVVGAGQWLRWEGTALPAALLRDGAAILEEPPGPLVILELEAPDLVVAEGTPMLALPLPEPLAMPEPGLVAALRANRARATPAHAAEALLDRLIGMPEAPRE